MTKWKTYPFNFSSESAQWPQEKLPFFPYKNKNKSPVFVWAVFLWMRAGTGHTGPSSLHVFIPAKDCSRLFHRLALHQPQRKNESPGALLGWIGKNQQTPSRSKQMVAPHPQYKVDYWTRGQIQCRTEQGNLFLREETETNTSVQPWVDDFMSGNSVGMTACVHVYNVPTSTGMCIEDFPQCCTFRHYCSESYGLTCWKPRMITNWYNDSQMLHTVEIFRLVVILIQLPELSSWICSDTHHSIHFHHTAVFSYCRHRQHNL